MVSLVVDIEIIVQINESLELYKKIEDKTMIKII
jgi:hypothetical protein